MAGDDITAVWNAHGTLTFVGTGTGPDIVDVTTFGDTYRQYLVTGTGTGQGTTELLMNPLRALSDKMHQKRDQEQRALHREAVFNLYNKITTLTDSLSEEIAAVGIAPKDTADLISKLALEMRNIERRDAEEKAEWLLDQHLDDQQRKTFAKRGFIQIKGKDANTYRINKEATTSVWIRGPKGHWTKRGEFCMYPSDHTMPMADKVLATKLYLEANEEGYLKEANFTGGRTTDYGFRKLLPNGKLKASPVAHRRYFGDIPGQYIAADWTFFDNH